MPTCPLGRLIVLMASAGMMVSVRLAFCVSPGLLESVTSKVNARLLTAAVGVPVIAPVAALRFAQDGNVPLMMDHVYGVVPPVAARVAL